MSIQIAVSQIASDSGLRTVSLEFGDSKHFELVDWPVVSDVNVKSDAQPDLFLVASITKPIVALGLLLLCAEGRIALTQRVGSVLPEFSKGVFRRITFRHLLTHTSGLPDTLPRNRELRASHATLKEFLKEAESASLEFAVGADCRYSSVGFMLIGAAVEKLSGVSAAEFLNSTLFEPLGMQDTWLGLPEDQIDNLAPRVQKLELPVWQDETDNWTWNSRYWLSLGAPWGGLVSTARDLGRFARMLLNDGRSDSGKRVVPACVLPVMFREHAAPPLPDRHSSGLRRGWGLGWRKQWPDHHASFGDFVSIDTVGHWGATGTLFWVDGVNGRFGVVLTTTPFEESHAAIQRISNTVTCAGN